MHHTRNMLIAAIITIGIFGCQNQPAESTSTRSDQIRQVATEYFKTFAQRSDWNKLLSFYREDLAFDDVYLQIHLDSLWQFKRFYKWDEEGGNFQKLTPDQEHISIEELLVNDSMAIGKGRVNPFYYYGELVDTEWGMEAMFCLYFDEYLKIKKQVDWIEYDPQVLESVIAHHKENGVGAIPEWLDLSK